ncbi:MAG: hypothetical protein PF569_04710 [Candidatus Woesearchaeota archaeon]|jgi:hypothetical protein|nr:hypothetical protein [Candidatus Woesearchaeota archaeon]
MKTYEQKINIIKEVYTYDNIDNNYTELYNYIIDLENNFDYTLEDIITIEVIDTIEEELFNK